jgi:hypothetical protein
VNFGIVAVMIEPRRKLPGSDAASSNSRNLGCTSSAFAHHTFPPPDHRIKWTNGANLQSMQPYQYTHLLVLTFTIAEAIAHVRIPIESPMPDSRPLRWKVVTHDALWNYFHRSDPFPTLMPNDCGPRLARQLHVVHCALTHHRLS